MSDHEYEIGERVRRISDGMLGTIVDFRDMCGPPTIPNSWSREYVIRFQGREGIYAPWAFIQMI